MCASFTFITCSSQRHENHNIRMSASSGDKRHLVPLLQFLHFVAKRGKAPRNRFPKKINGGAELGKDFFDPNSESSLLTTPPDCLFDFVSYGSSDKSPSLSQNRSTTFTAAPERRKRAHSPERSSEALSDSASTPIECEVVAKSPEKDCFTSRYFDFSLCDLGLELLVDLTHQSLTEEVAKQIQGLPCCYLLFGTSMIVAGDIVDVSLTGGTVLVSADRGPQKETEWVPLSRVYRLPENIGAVREEAAHRIERIMEAERGGEMTARNSPVQLAENPAAGLFPISPDKHEAQ